MDLGIPPLKGVKPCGIRTPSAWIDRNEPMEWGPPDLPRAPSRTRTGACRRAAPSPRSSREAQRSDPEPTLSLEGRTPPLTKASPQIS